MTLFELSFALTSVILALALTNIAASVHRLFLAGRRVRWAPEPILVTLLVTMIIVDVWTDQWHFRAIKQLNVGGSLLDVLRMMSLFFAAASTLPDPDLLGEGEIDLKTYYYATRRLTYGAMIVGLLLFTLANAMMVRPSLLQVLISTLVAPGLYGALIAFRPRWLHLLVLVTVLAGWGIPTFAFTLR